MGIVDEMRSERKTLFYRLLNQVEILQYLAFFNPQGYYPRSKFDIDDPDGWWWAGSGI